MFERWADLLLKRPKTAATAFALIFVALTSGAAQLRTDFSLMAFFGGDDPAKIEFEAYKTYWGPDDNVLIVVATLSEGAHGDFISPARMDTLKALQSRLAESEYVKTTLGLPDVPLLDSGTGMIDSRPLIERVPRDNKGFERFREHVLAHPLYVPTLLALDASATLILVETTMGSDDVANIQPMVRALRGVLEMFEGREDIHFATAGIPAVRSDFFEAFMRDQTLFIPLGILLIFILLTLIFRRAHGVLIPAAAAFIPVAMTFGLMGWTGEPIGIINQAYSVLLPAIAVADAIHLVSRFHEEARHRLDADGTLSLANRRRSVQRALQHVGAACALTSLTTAIGFASLFMARMPSMRSFGVYAAAGIVFAYVTLLVVTPLMLMRVSGPPPLSARDDTPGRLDAMLLWCGRFSVKHPLAVLGVTVLVLGVFGFFGTKTLVDNHLTAMLKPDHPTTRANHTADEKLGGILTLEVDLHAPKGGLITPQALHAMATFESWATAQDSVRTVMSPATFIVALADSITGTKGVPKTAAETAQLLLLADGQRALGRLLSNDRSRGRMQVRLRDIGGAAFTVFSDIAAQRLDAVFASTKIEARVTGTPHIAYRGINRVTEDLRESLLLAFFIIALIIGLAIRNVRVALVCLLPNALPLVVGYGFMGMTGWLLEPAGAVIFTVALGIAVDDTLHLIVRTREELSKGHALNDALIASVLHSGRAVLVTSLILCGGFGVLSLSAFPATVLMGSLGAIVIFVALLCDLFVLPALLALVGGALVVGTAEGDV